VVPFQFSEKASGRSEYPTATHLTGDVQDTPAKVPETDPGGGGRVCGVQLVPFQFSASGVAI